MTFEKNVQMALHKKEKIFEIFLDFNLLTM